MLPQQFRQVPILGLEEYAPHFLLVAPRVMFRIRRTILRKLVRRFRTENYSGPENSQRQEVPV